MDASRQDQLRRLPSVQEILLRPEVAALSRGERSLAEADVKDAVREAIRDRREAILAGTAPEGSEPLESEEIVRRARRLSAPSLQGVINATGVVVHTNLGRSPLPPDVLEAIGIAAQGYCNLEYDVPAGARGHRHIHAARLLRRVTGAEAALVVNNCAAAVLLSLSGLARDREVIVSRGEEVEIGGSFRVPDVMRQSGARLVEVGTTNRTRIEDYARAITPETGLLLKVHRSNFAVVGFTEEITLRELVALGRERSVPVMMDLGSGLMVRPPGAGFREEPTVPEAVQSGIDLLTFSGDKLLGGPQAGIVLGREEMIARLAAHPLLRALRPDKITLAALQAVLAHYVRQDASAHLPTLRMLHASRADVATRRYALLATLHQGASPGVQIAPVDCVGRAGGGSSPLTELDSAGVSVTWQAHSADALARRLRLGDPPVIGRIEQDRVILDLRTVGDGEMDALAAALRNLGADEHAGAGRPKA